jgi:uroporphyrinogen-III synthase
MPAFAGMTPGLEVGLGSRLGFREDGWYAGHEMRLLVTRPEPDALKLAAVLEEAGHEAVVEPLLSVSFEAGEPVEVDGAQALIATSRNALRALKARPVLTAARALPLFAVGKATAAEARALGFEVVVTGAGTAAQLVAHIVSALDPAAGLIVHLAGDTLATDLAGTLEAHGFRVMQPVVYRMVPATTFADTTVEQFAEGEIDGVILMSPRTAAIYADLVRRHGLAAVVRTLPHFCLSAAVARRLEPLGPVPTMVAEAPRLEEVLALIDDSAAQSDS